MYDETVTVSGETIRELFLREMKKSDLTISNEEPKIVFVWRLTEYLIRRQIQDDQFRGSKLGKLIKNLGVPKCFRDFYIENEFGFDTAALARLKKIIIDSYKQKQQQMVVMFYFRGKISKTLGELPASIFPDLNKYII